MHTFPESATNGHGHVRIIGPDGAELAYHATFQHNDNNRKRLALADALVEKVMATLEA